VNLPPGYTSRPATRDDLDAVVRLVEAVDLHDVGLTDPARDELIWEWSAPGFDLARDARLALDAQGSVVAFADVHLFDPSVQIRSWTQVHPDHRDAGLTIAALDWIEAHARASLPADVRETRLRHGGAATDEHTAPLLRERGFSLSRTFRQMARRVGPDEPEPAGVEGIEIRCAEPGEDDRAIYDVEEGAFAQHYGHESMPFEAWADRFFSDPLYDPTQTFLAVDGSRVVGFSFGLAEEGIGWIGELGVLRPWRRRGIGRALLLRTFAELGRRGITEVRLGVDAENADGATHLYETSGMSVRRDWHIYEKPISAG
jgi:mycothiol synthase